MVSAAVLAFPASSAAAVPPTLWQVPADGSSGAAAGQLDNPRGVAVNPSNGHVLVADLTNLRVDEFNAWGEFVKAWGWGVDDGSSELQVCTEESGCQAGLPGSGPGQLASPIGIAADPAGNAYVFDRVNRRVEKFDSEGNFVLMIGGEVNKGPLHPGNLCTAAHITEGDSCGIGTAGESNGQFQTETLAANITVSPGGDLFVGDIGRIQRFALDGTYKGDIKVPGEAVQSLAIDSLGYFYVVFSGKDDVHKLSPAGVEESAPKFPVDNPETVAVDAKTGDVYAIEDPFALNIGLEPRVVKFNASGSKLIPTSEEEEAAKKLSEESKTFEFFAEANDIDGHLYGLAVSNACNFPSAELYVSRFNAFNEGNTESAVRAYGSPPDPVACPPSQSPLPTVSDQYAISAKTDAAVLQAKINPHLQSGTTYYVEYGTGKCSEGGCATKVPVPAAALGGGPASTPVPTKGVFLPDLSAQTSYRFRFVVENDAGGPVFGVAPPEEEASFAAGLEGTFTTPPIPSPLPSPDLCPNASFRSGASAFLTDCRAYEMVSPLDKNSSDIFTLANVIGDPAALNQSAISGEKLTYSVYAAFGDAQSSPYTSQYIASRGGEGWSSHGISPPRNVSITGISALDTAFRAFSPDLCQGWILHDTDPLLAEGAIEGYANLYRRSNCGDERYEALTTVKPQYSKPNKYGALFSLQGISADGERAVFQINDKLTSNAATTEPGKEPKLQCYESLGGKLRLVSVMPSGTASKLHCSIGTENIGVRQTNLSNAVSDDASRIFWTASTSGQGAGEIFVRIDGKNPTVAVSEAGEALSGMSKSRFLAAAADGSKAIYAVGSIKHGEADLYMFDLDAKTTTLIAHKYKGMLGASEDASRIYLVSEEVLAQGATAGRPSLYLYEAGGGGDFSFIAEFSEADAFAEPDSSKQPTPVALVPRRHVSRISPDGLHAAFMAAGSLTGFDNLDANSGEAAAEVYLYDAGSEELDCVSCNPTGVRPSGSNIVEFGQPYWAAARIPGQYQLYASRVLSDDGSRLYFESFESLVHRDTNGKQDLYQWEAVGTGSCSGASHSFSAPNGGCLSLISSGESPQDSSFIDASSDGRDVFFTTGAGLVPWDSGLIDIYDARVGGGFPPPPAPPGPCQGDACQSPRPAPNDPTPASAGFRGAGNLKEPVKRRCAKGKRRVVRRGKPRCVRKRQHKRTASKHGRASR
jgi:hypothetical protein